MLESLLFILGILFYIGIFLNFLRTSLKGCGLKPAIFDFLFVICSIFVVLSPNPEEIKPASGIVVEQVRGGECSQNLNFAQKLVSFFIPGSHKPQPQPQCPASPKTSGTGKLNFAKGSGSGGGNSPSQDVPSPSQWKSGKDSYRYDKNQNSKNKNKEDEEETCGLNDNPVRIVNEEDLSCVKRITKKALSNNDVKKDYERIKTRLKNGVHPMDVSKKSTSLGEDFYLIKGSEGRYVVEYKGGDVINILGIADRGNQKNVKSWKKAMKDLYDIELKYTK